MCFQADFEFQGLIAATFAPMKANCDINVDVIPEYASFLERNDIKGIYGKFRRYLKIHGIMVTVSDTLNSQLGLQKSNFQCKSKKSEYAFVDLV